MPVHEAYLQLLRFYAKFHRSSVKTVLLIQAQCPQASLVVGMRRWNELGYQEAGGERALWILASVIKRDLDPRTGKEAEQGVGFRPASV